MTSVAPSRLAALTQLRCKIFQTAYNPTCIRTGAKYLRAHLRGPAMVQYYPDEFTVAKFNRMKPELKIPDFEEIQRLEDVAERKARGKGPPKKAKSAADSRRLARKR
ncbi:mitochondrial ribosomal subunit S27-domain-containing protein [Epithele typhae]|uniref:mitochondrial ribosomal subunit S27-domain-containing protein n=1 Tax=Epithele typhae TaxID=378194 RepID=UPI0020071F65|nr:mitochondrial ribosomal subunit S27-domain-containing protein [Epithele typhae]XP_047872870.1 mitochondrial ribosomal subunit S27-domain-containing protein [Epithele typhae]KAH9914523.1 mitochondrial ribosomal subunit S27-domain-containing protein [Epithele typhae]KAH9915235.1 mitochondrial ribosomal subunit S27-domain-containing protein [Epithele typhae]